MDDSARISWEKFLNPEIVRNKLILSSLFIAAFEMLKDCIEERIRDFFTDGFDKSEVLINEKHKTEVLSLNRSPTYASLIWLRNNNIIDDEDIKEFKKAKDIRNKFAHETYHYLSKDIINDPVHMFSKITELMLKIEKWWIINTEIPTDPEFYEKEIDEDSIIPGRIFVLRLMTDIALGVDNESKYYLNELKKENDCQNQ